MTSKRKAKQTPKHKDPEKALRNYITKKYGKIT